MKWRNALATLSTLMITCYLPNPALGLVRDPEDALENIASSLATAQEQEITDMEVPGGLDTPPPNRSEGRRPESPASSYQILLEVASGAELHRARALGFDLTKPGQYEVTVPRSGLAALKQNGLRFRVVGGTSRFTITPEAEEGLQPLPLANAEEPQAAGDTGTIPLSSGVVNLPIEDATGYAQGYRLRNASAPSGAQVTSLHYRTRISDNGDGDFWCGDYEIYLHSGDTSFELRVYDNLGGATDGGYDDDTADDADIYLNWRSTSYFNGEDPNQWWGILVYDNLSGDDGKMDYVEFEVDWEVPDTGDSYEPDNEWYQAWLHPHNYTSAFRSISPAGDRDWITFTLSGPSDIVVETLGSTGDTEIWLYDGSINQIGYDDDSGGGAFSRISKTALAPGTYYLKVEEYSNSAVIADYGISLSVTAANLPDLRAPGFNWAGSTVTEGDPFWVEAVIENSGGMSAGSSHARLFLSIDGDFDTSDDYEVLPEKSVSAISAGSSSQVRWDFNFPDVLDATSYLVWFVFEVDSRNEVAESDESNTFKAANTSYLTVLEPVDLVAGDVYFRTQSGGGGSLVTDPEPGQQVYPHLSFTVSAENVVPGPAWRIDLDGSPLCQSPDAITAGSYTGWCLSPWTATAGLHNLHGIMDPDDLTHETSESNNDTYRNYTIDSGSGDIRIEPLDLYFAFTGSTSSSQSAATSKQDTERGLSLRLQSGTIDLGGRTDAARTLPSALEGVAPGARRHLLLQFRRLLTPAERAELEAEGIRILGYLPDNAYWASVIDADGTPTIAQGGGIHRAWHPPAELKTSQGILAGQFPPNARFRDGTVTIHARTFEDVSRDEAVAAFESITGVVVEEEVFGGVFALRLHPGAMQRVAALDLVEWVEAASPPDQSDNVVSAQRIGVDQLQAAPYGLDGTGIDVGIWDEGSVDGHTDFGARLTLHDAATGALRHATHVAGTVGGSGAGDASARGMAPASSLHSWDWTNDELEMRNEAPGAGVVLSNHSYGFITGWHRDGANWVDAGSGGFGSYGTAAAEWDDIVFDTGLLVFKSAGNDRNDGPDWPEGPRRDGPYDCIPQKGNAKNLITVCATEDDDSMTEFSSWGPADDGRVKPDLCANGTGLWSTVLNDGYGSDSGTSMSSPSAAGAGALLFELFQAQGAGDPQPHLLKALLIHGAQDLGRTGPDYEFGWGLIDAETSAALIENGSWAVSSIPSTGDEVVWSLNVPSGAPELRVTAVWTDPEGSPAAAQALVNDLDLVLEAPGGTLHRPWVLDSGNPGAAASRGVNSVDNVEQVVVTNPEAGNWTVRIEGTAVALGPQEVAVVAEGLGGSSPPPGARSFTIYNDGTAALQVTDMVLEQAGPWIAWTPAAPFTLESGQQQRVDVTVDFALAPEGTSTRRLSVHSDDPDESPYPGGVDLHVEKTTCYTLSRSHTGEGSLPSASPTSSPGCPTNTYTAGEVIGLTASPAAGWKIAGWSGTIDDTSQNSQNTVTMPSSSHTVSVTYVEQQTCAPVSLSGQTIDDTRLYEACEELSAGEGFAIVAPGDVTFRSGKTIILRDGFSIGSGATFRAVIDPTLAAAGTEESGGS